MEGECNGGLCGNQSISPVTSQIGAVAPAGFRNEIRDVCLEECSPRNNRDSSQDHQSPKTLVEDPSLRDKDYLQD